MMPGSIGVQVVVERGYGSVVRSEYDGVRWRVEARNPAGEVEVIGESPKRQGAVLLLVRAYHDGVSTKRLCEHLGVDVVQSGLRTLIGKRKVGRTRAGRLVERGSRFGVDFSDRAG